MLQVAVLVCLVALGASTPIGVPNSACEDMTPRHGNFKAQTSTMPYVVSFDHTSIKNSESVEMTIEGQDSKAFGGFMVQARDDNSDTPSKAIGTFQAKDANGGTMKCYAENDTGSHKNPGPKSSVTLVWTPPANFKGQASFYVTIAETREVFWARQKAGTVNVEE